MPLPGLLLALVTILSPWGSHFPVAIPVGPPGSHPSTVCHLTFCPAGVQLQEPLTFAEWGRQERWGFPLSPSSGSRCWLVAHRSPRARRRQRPPGPRPYRLGFLRQVGQPFRQVGQPPRSPAGPAATARRTAGWGAPLSGQSRPRRGGEGAGVVSSSRRLGMGPGLPFPRKRWKTAVSVGAESRHGLCGSGAGPALSCGNASWAPGEWARPRRGLGKLSLFVLTQQLLPRGFPRTGLLGELCPRPGFAPSSLSCAPPHNAVRALGDLVTSGLPAQNEAPSPTLASRVPRPCTPRASGPARGWAGSRQTRCPGTPDSVVRFKRSSKVGRLAPETTVPKA